MIVKTDGQVPQDIQDIVRKNEKATKTAVKSTISDNRVDRIEKTLKNFGKEEGESKNSTVNAAFGKDVHKGLEIAEESYSEMARKLMEER